jgi:hypothetical protein
MRWCSFVSAAGSLHHRRDECSYRVAAMETIWTWFRAALSLPRRPRHMKFLLFRLENLTNEVSVAMLGDMASYLGTRRRHVDFLTVISSGCPTR